MKNTANNPFRERLIFALDVGGGMEEALSWVDRLWEHVGLFKVGKESFVRCGTEIVRQIHGRGGKVFLDLKFHDIPHTFLKKRRNSPRVAIPAAFLGEVDGKDYLFISTEEFRERIDRGEFIEWVENYGNLYGTSKKTMGAFLERGHDLILDVEPRGAKAIREHYPRAVFVLILPPSLAELKSRLAKRGESAAVMECRLQTALDEIREALWYDYVVFNERLDEAVDRFRAVYIAEKCRRDRHAGRIAAFL